jgi:hypothetical protein
MLPGSIPTCRGWRRSRFAGEPDVAAELALLRPFCGFVDGSPVDAKV